MAEIAKNRKVKHDYEILDQYECGVVLRGTEVKSIRAGHVNIRDAFVRIEKDEAWLYNCDIQMYGAASHVQHEPRRPRRLLLHKKEIGRLEKESTEKRLALPVTRMYWKGSLVKIEVAVGRGKAKQDRRETLKRNQDNREAAREMANFNRGR